MSLPRLQSGMNKCFSTRSSTVFGFLFLVTFCGCLGFHHRQAGGNMLDDKVTNERVEAALKSNAEFQFGAVQVRTTNGIVTLGGFVRSVREKVKAVELAKSVRRVKSLKDDLLVKP